MGYSFMQWEKIDSVHKPSQKHDSKGGLDARYKHNYRINEVPNANISLSEANEELTKYSGESYFKAIKKKIEELPAYKSRVISGKQYEDNEKGFNEWKTDLHIRKNAVIAMEVMTSVSFADSKDINIALWKKDNLEWMRENFNASDGARKEFGDNVISMVYHADESSVHCHAIILPIDERGKLNCARFTGGWTQCRKLQDSYGDCMLKNHGLMRGIKNSSATHEAISRFHGEVRVVDDYVLPEIKEHETIEEYRERANSEIKMVRMGDLRERKRLERAVVESKAKEVSVGNTIEQAKIEKENSKYREERERIKESFGVETIGQVYGIAQTFENLNTGLHHFPDEEQRKNAAHLLNLMTTWGANNSSDKKKKKKEKEKDMFKDSEDKSLL